MIRHIFFDLLQYSLGNKTEFSHRLEVREWQALFSISTKQTLAGVCFAGIERLPKDMMPPKEVLLKWWNAAEQIKKRNERLYEAVGEAAESLKKAGFRSVILKGQGIARLYPNPLLRTCGDIDVWVDADRDEIMAFVKKNVWHTEAVYHNISIPLINDVIIELHFTPSWMFSYFNNRRLQKFFRETADRQFSNKVQLPECREKVCVPTLAFNRVYILLHIYRHLFGEGIGLRQLLDYYYVLTQGFSEEERTETLNTLRKLGMLRFTAAVMWVLQKVFGMSDKFLLLTPDEKEGRFLLNEIMMAGNFGHYDKRIQRSSSSELSLFIQRCSRNLRFIHSYPSEVIWAPAFKIWHFFWRRKQNIAY